MDPLERRGGSFICFQIPRSWIHVSFLLTLHRHLGYDPILFKLKRIIFSLPDFTGLKRNSVTPVESSRHTFACNLPQTRKYWCLRQRLSGLQAFITSDQRDTLMLTIAKAPGKGSLWLRTGKQRVIINPPRDQGNPRHPPYLEHSARRGRVGGREGGGGKKASSER